MKFAVVGHNIEVRKAIIESLNEEIDFEVFDLDFLKPVNDNEIEKLEDADIIIIDLTAIKKNSRLLITEIKENFPKPKIIVLHFYNELSFVKPMLQAGASAYLLVDNSRSEMKNALAAIQKGKQYTSVDVV